MWLLKLLLMFVLRQSRWAVRLLAFGAATLVFRILGDLEMIRLPGMEQPYEIGTADPYVVSAIVYMVISRSLRKLTSGVIANVGHGFDRLRGGD